MIRAKENENIEMTVSGDESQLTAIMNIHGKEHFEAFGYSYPFKNLKIWLENKSTKLAFSDHIREIEISKS